MIVALVGGGAVHVADEVGQGLTETLGRKQPPLKVKFPDANGEIVLLAASQITGIWSEDQWDAIKREKRGEWKCPDEHWHQANERWCNIERPRPRTDLSELRRAPEDPDGPESVRAKWIRLIQINNQFQRQSGKYGTLRTLEELEHYDATGEWPPHPGFRERGMMVTKKVASMFPGEADRYVSQEVFDS